MNKGILVVYNTCTISRAVVSLWKEDVKTILDQNFKDCKLVVSECRGPRPDLDNNVQMKDFIEYIVNNDGCYNVFYEHRSPFVTFNHTTMKMVEKFGNYEYYLYVSSGIKFPNNDIFRNVYEFLKDNQDIARANLCATNDNCYPPKGTPGPPSSWQKLKPYCMTPGYYINDHCSVFSNYLYEMYEGRTRPDIYVGHGNEGIYSYLTSAVGKKNVLLPFDVCPPLPHNKSQDGGGHRSATGHAGLDWFLIHKTATQQCQFISRLEKSGVIIDSSLPSPKGRTNGNLSHQNREALLKKFGEDGITMDKQDRLHLYNLLKKEFFVSKEIIDYDNINSKFIGE